MRFLTAVLMLVLASSPSHADSTRLLKFDGAEIESPYWFKESFLEFGDDLAEAAESDKTLMLYFHQAGCPYCFNMIQQNFLDPQLAPFIQKKFDVVALDLWGDRDVVLPDGTELTEKTLATHWKIQYTPTLIFLNPDGSINLRIDGYRPKPVFSQVLDYVLSGQTEGGLAQALIQQSNEDMYPEAFLLETRDLSSLKGQLTAVMLEYKGCDDCESLHRNAIARPAVYEQLEPYQVVRFDAASDQPLTLPDGTDITPSRWVKELGVNYYPTTLLFDESGIERFRIGGYVQSFHYATALEYVSAKGYEKFPEFQRFLNDRADRMREKGMKVVITE